MNQTLSKRLLTLAVSVLLSLAAMAQEVEWSHHLEICPSTGEAVLLLTATIEPGWHLYDMELCEGGPQPTVISFSESEGVEAVGDIQASVASIKNEDPTYGLVIGYWEESVTFTQRFTLTRDTAVIKGKVNYMACSDRNCMPPQSYTFTCEVSRPTSMVEMLKSITAEDVETCCCIGWGK